MLSFSCFKNKKEITMAEVLDVKVSPSQELLDLFDSLHEACEACEVQPQLRKIKVSQTKTVGVVCVETYVETEYSYEDHIDTAYMINSILEGSEVYE